MKNSQRQQGAAEQQFAQRLVALLDQGLEQLDDSKLEKLAFARKLALRAQRSPQQPLAALARPAFGLAGRTLAFSGGPARPGRSGRTGLSLAVIGLVFICLFGIFQVEQQRRIEELADIDSALLSDELPISAYADHGFNTYLKQNH